MSRISIHLPLNISTLFTELPLGERPAAARAAGLTNIEVWWPFGANPTPVAAEVDAFIRSVTEAGVALVAMNLYGGDLPAGDRGVIAHPERRDEFLASLDVAARIAEELGTRLFNVSYGHRRDGIPVADQDTHAAGMLTAAMTRLDEFGGTIMLEALSGIEHYPLKSAEDVADRIHAIRTSSGGRNLGMLLDQFHLERNGHDAIAAVRAHAGILAHIQIADLLDRGEPGSGTYDFPAFADTLRQVNYRGLVALEYAPRGQTSAGIAEFGTLWNSLFAGSPTAN